MFSIGLKQRCKSSRGRRRICAFGGEGATLWLLETGAKPKALSSESIMLRIGDGGDDSTVCLILGCMLGGASEYELWSMDFTCDAKKTPSPLTQTFGDAPMNVYSEIAQADVRYLDGKG